MAKVVYRGRSDSKILNAADLRKADVEGFSQKTFHPNEVVELDQEVVDALVGRPEIFGRDFFEVQDEPEAREAGVDDEAEDADPVKIDKSEVEDAAARGARTTRTQGTTGGTGTGGASTAGSAGGTSGRTGRTGRSASTSTT